MLHSLLHTFGQTYYTYSSPTPADHPWFMGGYGIIGLAFLVLMLASLWRVFTKAGEKGWASLIPFYNTYVLLRIVGRPGWWLILFFIPLVNLITGIVVYYDLAKAFGKSVGYLLLLLFLPFIGYPMLAFGDAKYRKPGKSAKSK